jgi:hypothetical protein
MSSTLVDAVASRINSDAATFASLPLTLAQRIFLALPVDARGRACCVCRAWRDALAEPSLWTRLDMSAVSAERRLFLPVLHGAARRARGQLRLLDLSQQLANLDDLLPVLTANAGSLRELHLRFVTSRHSYDGDNPLVEPVLAAAPLLQVLTAEIGSCTWEDAPQLLRAEPPCALLQMRHYLTVHFSSNGRSVGGLERVAPFSAALADASLQPALSHLAVDYADTAQPAVMCALADAAIARRLRGLTLQSCTPPATAPLVRLLAQGSLAVLNLFHPNPLNMPMFDPAGAALVADALRVNTTLTELHLSRANLCVDVRVAVSLLGALVGHPSLRELLIIYEDATDEDCIVFGAALAALVAADAPALHVLDCWGNSLQDAGLAPIVDALALNRHLRTLKMGFNGMSEAFARDRLLPAVRANTTLRNLVCGNTAPGVPAAAEAEELVRLGAQHD